MVQVNGKDDDDMMTIRVLHYQSVNQSIKTWIYVALPLKQKFTDTPVTSRHAENAMT